MSARPFRPDSERPKGRHQFRRARPGQEQLSFGVSRPRPGMRLDQYLMNRFTGYSRAFLQSLIKEGRVLVDGKPSKPSASVTPGDEIVVNLPEGMSREPEDLDLKVIYRDDTIFAINKRPGIVVHPARGHTTGTILQGIFHLFREELAADPTFQVGPVHRIDIGTSGLLLCAHGEQTRKFLQSQFEHRQVQKTYLAICHGEPAFDEIEVDVAIGAEPDEEKLYAVDGTNPRSALTRFTKLAAGGGYALLSAEPHTGRTHQIRIHAAHLGHPLVGDEPYGGRSRDVSGAVLLDRAALHSSTITFIHPGTGEPMTLEAPLWADMRAFLRSHGLDDSGHES
jgi:23S rRNA pseudouridine1911/1915/1917 synthase